TGVRIENFVQLFSLVACCVDNLAIAKLQADAIETGALINARRVERDATLNGIFHGAAENFTVGNVAIASANHSWNSLDAKADVGTRSLNLDTVRPFHQRLQRFHARLQFAVIQRADFKVEIFEGLRAHSGQLRHRRRGP